MKCLSLVKENMKEHNKIMIGGVKEIKEYMDFLVLCWIGDCIGWVEWFYVILLKPNY